jgi:hypothetical protein
VVVVAVAAFTVAVAGLAVVAVVLVVVDAAALVVVVVLADAFLLELFFVADGLDDPHAAVIRAAAARTAATLTNPRTRRWPRLPPDGSDSVMVCKVICPHSSCERAARGEGRSIASGAAPAPPWRAGRILD